MEKLIAAIFTCLLGMALQVDKISAVDRLKSKWAPKCYGTYHPRLEWQVTKVAQCNGILKRRNDLVVSCAAFAVMASEHSMHLPINYWNSPGHRSSKTKLLLRNGEAFTPLTRWRQELRISLRGAQVRKCVWSIACVAHTMAEIRLSKTRPWLIPSLQLLPGPHCCRKNVNGSRDAAWKT